MSHEAPVPAATLDLNTYAGIKAARRNKGPLPTMQNFETALLASRQRIADLAVASAVASGESHIQVKLPFPVETIQGAKTSWQINEEEAKEKRHLSKLIYFFAKLQADPTGAKFFEQHTPAAVSHPHPSDEYEPDEEEEEDEDSEDEEEDTDND